jgi:co-chaperonin GroES (HSP10)
MPAQAGTIKGTIKPIKDKVLGVAMEFGERLTRGGLLLPGDNTELRGIRPRWCQVHAVGPDQEDVKPGDWVLVAHGRWSRGVDVEQEDGTVLEMRMIDVEEMLLVADEKPSDEYVARGL